MAPELPWHVTSRLSMHSWWLLHTVLLMPLIDFYCNHAYNIVYTVLCNVIYIFTGTIIIW